MARAVVIVYKKAGSDGWKYVKGYPAGSDDLAVLQARLMERNGTPARVYRRTPEGPEMIYESPKS